MEPITWLFRLWKEGERNGAQVRSDWKRGRKRVAGVGRGQAMATIDGIVWEANYLPGASCHRASRSFDRASKVRFRRLSMSGYKVTPFLFAFSSSLLRYLDNESGLKFHLSLRIFVMRTFEIRWFKKLFEWTCIVQQCYISSKMISFIITLYNYTASIFRYLF